MAGRNYLEVRNQGAVHARLTDASFKQGGQTRPLVDGLLGYVLPGATMRWPVPDGLSADQPLQVRINGAQQLENLAPTR